MAVKNANKACASCLRFLALKCFGSDKQKSDGLSSYCRECKRRKQSVWRLLNQSKANSATLASRKRNAAHYKLYSVTWEEQNRIKRQEQENKRRKLNPEETRRKSRLQYKNNPLARKNAIKRYVARNPEVARVHEQRRRARERGAAGSFTKQQIRDLFSAQGGSCVYCPADLAIYYAVDHKIALARGGSNDIGNIQLLCKSCNSRKGTKSPEEFIKMIRADNGPDFSGNEGFPP